MQCSSTGPGRIVEREYYVSAFGPVVLRTLASSAREAASAGIALGPRTQHSLRRRSGIRRRGDSAVREVSDHPFRFYGWAFVATGVAMRGLTANTRCPGLAVPMTG